MARSAPFASASRMVCAARAGPSAERHDFAAVLFLQLQRLFQRVGVRLVDLVAEIDFLDPFAGGVDAQLRVARGHLLDGTMIFIGILTRSSRPRVSGTRYRLKISAPLVPPKPNEFDSAYSISIGRAWFGT